VRPVRRRETFDRQWSHFAERLHYVPIAGAAGLADKVAHTSASRRLAAASPLPEHPAVGSEFVVRTLKDANLVDRARIILEKPSAWTSHRQTSQRHAARHVHEEQVFRIDHFLGKEAARTSWPSASPTACSSRSGTATTSTTSRSTCLRSFRSGPGGLLRGHRAFRDMVVTTCSRSSPSWPWSPHRARAECDQRGEEQGLPLLRRSTSRAWCAGSTRATGLPGSPPTRRPRPSSPCAARSTTALAGVPFFLRTGKRMARARASSRSPSVSRRRACSRRARCRAQGPDHLTFDLAMHRSFPSRSTASARGQGCP